MAAAVKNTKPYEPSAELVAQSEPVKTLLSTKKGASVAEVLRTARSAVVAAKERAADLVRTGGKLPAPKGQLSLVESERAAIDKAVQLAANAPLLPTAPRELSEEELEGLTRRFLAAKAVVAIFDTQVKGIRAAVLNHLTIEGERTGTVDSSTPRDKTGWALVERRFGAEGEADEMSVETQNGAARIGAADIEAMEEAGLISHRDVLTCTEFVRVIDETGWFELIKRKPYLATLMAERATFESPKVSFNVR